MAAREAGAKSTATRMCDQEIPRALRRRDLRTLPATWEDEQQFGVMTPSERQRMGESVPVSIAGRERNEHM
jgi:hypothetical protein